MAADTSVFATALAAAGTGFLGYFWLRLREDTTKRLDLTRAYAAKQIEEFYAPLVALTDQLDTTANACDLIRITQSSDNKKANDLIYENNFAPVHEEIFQILKTKIHLAEGRVIPNSFRDYLLHYRNQKIRTTLAKQGIETLDVENPFPSQFYWDIRAGLKVVAVNYDDSVRELKYGVWPFFGAYKNWYDKQFQSSGK